MTQSQDQGNSTPGNRTRQSGASYSAASALASLQGLSTEHANQPGGMLPSPANTQQPGHHPPGVDPPHSQPTPQNHHANSSQQSSGTGQTAPGDPPTTQHPNNEHNQTQNPPAHGNSNTQSRTYSQTEVDAMLRRIAALETAAKQPMIASDDDVERARAQAKAIAELNKEQPLPNPEEGFKDDPMHNPISDRIDEAIKANKYVPLSAIASSAKQYTPDEEELTLTENGWKKKPIDRKGEKTLPFNEWLAAGKTLISRIRHHHGSVRADKMAEHLNHVSDIFNSHGMAVAYAYDIRQRELASRNPKHDIAPLDVASLGIIASAAYSASANRLDSIHASLSAIQGEKPRSYSSSQLSPNKRKWQSFDHPPSPVKRKPTTCFRCGGVGHVIGSCTESTTKAGTPCATLAKRGKDSTMVSPSGKLYCFRWTRESACRYDSECRGYHACSICGKSDHGAAACEL